MVFYSAKINDIHMKEKYGMVLSEMHYASPPIPKKVLISIPGADGAIDLSSIHGDITYENRTVSMTFATIKDRSKWPSLYSEILNNFDGQEVKIIFDDDPEFYYKGRAEISAYERFQRLGTIKFTVNADPYKYELSDGTNDWIWNTFSLEDGIIREYRNIVVDGTASIIIIGRRKRVIPTITCSAPMALAYGSLVIHLNAGTTKLYELQLGEGEHTLEFSGQGTVSISYRGGSL